MSENKSVIAFDICHTDDNPYEYILQIIILSNWFNSNMVFIISNKLPI